MFVYINEWNYVFGALYTKPLFICIPYNLVINKISIVTLKMCLSDIKWMHFSVTNILLHVLPREFNVM